MLCLRSAQDEKLLVHLSVSHVVLADLHRAIDERKERWYGDEGGKS